MTRARSRPPAAWSCATGEEGYEVLPRAPPALRRLDACRRESSTPTRRFEEAALREVEEETGLRCELGPELPSTHYTDSKGRPKIVRYWLMEPMEGEFEPNDEVDELRWMTLSRGGRGAQLRARPRARGGRTVLRPSPMLLFNSQVSGNCYKVRLLLAHLGHGATTGTRWT